MVEPLIRVTNPVVAAASIGNVAVMSLAGQLSAEHIDELERAFQGHQRQWGPANVSLTLLKGHVPLPDARARARLQEMHAAGGTAEIACVVVEADGFWAAAARGVLASMALVSRKAPHATRTLDEALQWAAKRLPPDAPDVRTTASAIERFRAQHLAQATQSPPGESPTR